MIIEDYVDFDTAKLLKEKGFDETVRCFYDIQTEILCDNCVKTKNSYTESIAAPTLQMAMKWLREVHKYFIGIGFKKGSYLFIIKDIKKNLEIGISDKEFITYEEACEAAIEYCLINLIMGILQEN